jgi:hypothetical protein
MARYDTTDPILFSATADKRKGLSVGAEYGPDTNQ